MHGFICVNKPTGPSSFDCIRQLKHRLPDVKIGHAGTLDPAAQGLLVLALGNATTLLPYVTLQPKVYDFDIRFGMETDTLDCTGKILRESGPVPLQPEVEQVLRLFLGEIEQTPPLFSAVKVDGRRAYSRARENETFSVRPRRITVTSLTLTAWNAAEASGSFSMTCSAGTYVRSLARDIAAALKTFGLASRILRLGCGRFSLEGALTPEALQNAEPLPLLPLWEACNDLPVEIVSVVRLAELRHGRSINLDRQDNAGTIIAFNEQKECVAVLKKQEEKTYHPVKVLI